MAKVIFLTQTSQVGASARYRVYQYLPYLEKEGIECEVSAAVGDGLLRRYCAASSPVTKAGFYLAQIIKRITDLPAINKADIVFLQRDIIIHFYPVLEKIIALLNKNIIFDFDDAIYLYPSNKRPGLFWDKKKIERIIGLSRHVIAGNNFLRSYAVKFNDKVTVIPTSVDLNLYNTGIHRVFSKGGIFTVGWIGSQGTFHYLENIFPVFKRLAESFPLKLKVIGARGPQIDGVPVEYRDWENNTEIQEINSFDLGVMPLLDDEWSQGKCGTKILQYMASGVPAIASAVGVNREIIQDGINGFLAVSAQEWHDKICHLAKDSQARDRICLEARKTVEERYSIKANAPKFIKVIKETLS